MLNVIAWTLSPQHRAAIESAAADTIRHLECPPDDAHAWVCNPGNGKKGPELIVHTFALYIRAGGGIVFIPDHLRRLADTTIGSTLKDSEIETIIDRLAESSPELYLSGSLDFIQRAAAIAKRKRINFSTTA